MAGRRFSPRTHFCGFMLGHLGVVGFPRCLVILHKNSRRLYSALAFSFSFFTFLASSLSVGVRPSFFVRTLVAFVVKAHSAVSFVSFVSFFDFFLSFFDFFSFTAASPSSASPFFFLLFFLSPPSFFSFLDFFAFFFLAAAYVPAVMSKRVCFQSQGQ